MFDEAKQLKAAVSYIDIKTKILSSFILVSGLEN
jgi:hypothetical protein